MDGAGHIRPPGFVLFVYLILLWKKRDSDSICPFGPIKLQQLSPPPLPSSLSRRFALFVFSYEETTSTRGAGCVARTGCLELTGKKKKKAWGGLGWMMRDAGADACGLKEAAAVCCKNSEEEEGKEKDGRERGKGIECGAAQ